MNIINTFNNLMSIQAVNYECEDMGRYFKSYISITIYRSKKKYRWTFLLDEK